MNLGMAVHALLAQHSLVTPVRRQPGAAVNATGMEIAEMALLAQVGLPGDQQVLVVRTMRRVTIAAIFLDGGVLPQERTPFFGVAVVALFIDGIADQVGWPGPAVRLVAIRAGQQTDV